MSFKQLLLILNKVFLWTVIFFTGSVIDKFFSRLLRTDVMLYGVIFSLTIAYFSDLEEQI
jgi:hypothetical protein